MGKGILHSIVVVLSGDHCQRFGLIAVTLEIAARDLPKKSGKAAADTRFFRPVRSAEQDIPNREIMAMGVKDGRAGCVL